MFNVTFLKLSERNDYWNIQRMQKNFIIQVKTKIAQIKFKIHNFLKA